VILPDAEVQRGESMRLAGAVIFVRDLQRSQRFYQELLELEVQVTEPEAVLLSGAEGDHLALRALAGAGRLARSVGVQYLMWTARDLEDLGRARQVLEGWGAVSTRAQDGLEVVEGLDPDRTVIILVYPAVPSFGAVTLPGRLFAY
jgi:catechol 2,3-dioxygenase-like lactoylglutathione lyase family enzyme